jgi:Flp pilus assembly pilin Flp
MSCHESDGAPARWPSLCLAIVFWPLRFVRVGRSLQAEDGATAVEYAVLLAMIISTCAASIGYFGDKVGSSLQDTSAKLSDVFGGAGKDQDHEH